MIEKIYDSLLALAYPAACQICSRIVEQSANGNACETCWRRTRIYGGKETTCRKCGKLNANSPADFGELCHECDKHFYDKAAAVGVYEYALLATIIALKKDPFINSKARNLISSAFSRTPFQTVDRIVPTPLAKRRLLERRFNQAEVIARVISRQTGIRIDNHSLVRIKHATVHRAGMDRRGRELSVDRSFQYRKSQQLNDEKILLIDDVFASGATASECAKMLKKNGAAKVYVFTIARAV